MDPATLAILRPRYQRGAVIWSGPGNAAQNEQETLFAAATSLAAVGVPFDILNVSDVPAADLSRYSVIALAASSCEASVLTAVRSKVDAWTRSGGLLLVWRYPLTYDEAGVSQGSAWALDLIGATAFEFDDSSAATLDAYANGEVELDSPDSPLYGFASFYFATLDPARVDLEFARANNSTRSDEGGLWSASRGNGTVIATTMRPNEWSRHDTNLIALYVKAVRHYLPAWVTPLPKAGLAIRVDADSGDTTYYYEGVRYLAAKDFRGVMWAVTTDRTELPAEVPAHWDVFSHSETHPGDMSALTEEQVLEELLTSYRKLQREHGAVEGFALPGAREGWYDPAATLRDVNHEHRIYRILGVNAYTDKFHHFPDGDVVVLGTPLSDYSASEQGTTFDETTGAVYDDDKSKWMECFSSSGFLLNPSFHDYVLGNTERQAWLDDRITHLRSLDTIEISMVEYAQKLRSWASNGVVVRREATRFVIDLHHAEPDFTIGLPDPGSRAVVVRDRFGTNLPVDTTTDGDGNLLVTLRTGAVAIPRPTGSKRGGWRGMPGNGTKVGYWTVPATGRTTATLPQNSLRAAPVFFTRPVSLDRLAVEVTTAASGGLVRLGIYNSSPDGSPFRLVLDGGTVDASTTGVKELTVDVDLPPGTYWLAAVVQDVASLGLAGINNVVSALPALATNAANALGANSQAGVASGATVSGALPVSFALSFSTHVAPKVAARIA